MSLPADPIVRLELPVIAKIIQDEVWLEGERRGCAVSPHDPVVRGTVCAIVLRVGHELREQCEAKLGECGREAAADVGAECAA